MVTPEALLDSSHRSARVVFVGLPTALGKQHLSRVKYSEMVLFDYHDTPAIHADYSDLDFLLGLTDRYWKPCVEATWRKDIRWGCLPLRRSATLSNLLRVQALKTAVFGQSPKRVDVGFVGLPTSLRILNQSGDTTYYPQRVEWVTELHRELSRYSFWGGLVLNPTWKKQLQEQHGDLSAVEFGRRRMSYWRYIQELQSCRVLLTPAGNARWTYRHYEAAYAGAVLLSTDLRNTQLLAPLPKTNAIMVPDNTSIIPYLDEALDLSKDTESLSRGIDELEQSFQFGSYSRKKRHLLDRFLAQLESIDSNAIQPPAQHAA